MQRDGTAPLIRREDYAAPAYWIRRADLTFDLDPAKTIVGSRLEIERNPQADPDGSAPLRLHGEGLNLLRVLADGASVSFRHEGGELVIDKPPVAGRFVLEIRNTCAPDKNTALTGLYTSNGGFFTQCEAEGFRRITYFLDRPDVMAVYTVTLRADKAKYPVLLSNGNLVDQGDLDPGPGGPRHYAKWHDPFAKPSYLFALVAGRLVAREQRVRARNGREHLLQVYVRPGDLEKTEHAMRSLVASVVWDEARFGLALDLDRFMIVAVEDYNMGAMENKGLNIFNTKAVLASAATSTDADFDAVESIVGHEYFHNWTGNRITCRDWFQLSLKEGLTVFRDQEFSMDMAGSASARAVCRIQDVRQLRQRQFPEDAGTMAHPVRPEAYSAIDNFYTPTVYEKGAEVVRMMQALVGRDGFARGLALYFERHDGQAVTCDDFAQAVADANPDSQLASRLGAFKRWYAQAGTPRLQARGVHDAAARTYTLTLSQRGGAAQPGAQAFVMPVALGLLARDGRPLPLHVQGETAARGTETLLVLDQAEQSWVFTGVDEAPVPSLLRGFSAPVLLDDGLSDADLLLLHTHDSDPFNRWEAGQRLAHRYLLAAVAADAPAPLDDAWVQALRTLLHHPQLDAAFKEVALTLPSESELAEGMATADPQRIHAAREALLDELSERLHADWQQAWDAHQVREGYRPDAGQSGRRALANLALAMLCRHAVRHATEVWPGRAYQRVKDAANMTDRLTALNALMQTHSPLAERALAHFHAAHRHEPLALDKWFGVQALAPETVGDGPSRVLPRVRELLKHPDFTLRNPNRMRSLVSQLCTANPAAFHRPDAAGYVFWAEQLLAVDALNPLVASRLARAMDRWRSLAEPCRSAAREAIARVAARADLSADTREIINRALEGA